MSLEELQHLVDKYKDDVPELSQAYGEMLNHCSQHPGIPLGNFAKAQTTVRSDMQDLKVCGMTDASKQVMEQMKRMRETDMQRRE